MQQANNYPPFSSGIRTPDWSGVEPDDPLCPPQKYAATAPKNNSETTISVITAISTVLADAQWATRKSQIIK